MAGIFPLPVSSSGRSRRRRGWARMAAILENEAAHSLNWLSGVDGSGPATTPVKPHLQQKVLADIRDLVSEVRPAEPRAHVYSADAALRELLRGRSLYDTEDGLSSTMASFNPHLVSLPELSEVQDSPDVRSVCPEDVAFWLEGNHERMLRCPLERESLEREREIQIYTDPILSRNRKGYERFVQKLHRLGLVCFVRDRKCDVGLFFVKKKETQQRMIMDCRKATRFFRDPPGVCMCTSESLARIEVSLPSSVDPRSAEGEARMRELSVHIGIADVSNCFHRLRIPMTLSRYFALPPVRAKAFGLVGNCLDGVILTESDWVYPASAVLPMGIFVVPVLCAADQRVSAQSGAIDGHVPARERFFRAACAA